MSMSDRERKACDAMKEAEKALLEAAEHLRRFNAPISATYMEKIALMQIEALHEYFGSDRP